MQIFKNVKQDFNLNINDVINEGTEQTYNTLLKRIEALEKRVKCLESRQPKSKIDIFDLGTIKKDGNGKR